MRSVRFGAMVMARLAIRVGAASARHHPKHQNRR